MALRMLEEHTYFCVYYLNWQRDDTWAELGPVWRDSIFGEIPWPFRDMLQVVARTGALRDLHGQARYPLLHCAFAARVAAFGDGQCVWYVMAHEINRCGDRLVCHISFDPPQRDFSTEV